MNVEEYIHSLFGQQDDILTTVQQSIVENDMPMISVTQEVGQFLSMLVRISGAKSILEIGTLAGYSAICLLRGAGASGHLTSLELKQEFANVAKGNLEHAGFAGQVDFRVGDALKTLDEFKDSGRKFDFFFIDADKGNYSEYLLRAITLANRGALVVTDNVLRNNRVLNPYDDAPSTVAIREFNELAASHPQLDAMLLPLGDGLMVARVKDISV